MAAGEADRRRIRLRDRRSGFGRVSVGQSAVRRREKPRARARSRRPDNWIWFHIPVGYLFAIGNPRSDWCFKTEPEPGLNGRALNYPRGKAIGGSSSINAMIYMRGQAADYDHWRQLGLAGWGWDDVLPYFKRHENHFLGDERQITAPTANCASSRRACSWALLDAFRAAAEQAGIKSDHGLQHRRQRGLRRLPRQPETRPALVGGERVSQAGAQRGNLRLETGCLVEGIMFEGRRAVGVRWRQDGETRFARCRGEVILAAGAIGSPQIMLLSGVGPAEHLREHGIPVVARPAGRRRQSAGSSAAPPDLQGRRHRDAQRALSFAARLSPRMLPNMRCSGAAR